MLVLFVATTAYIDGIAHGARRYAGPRSQCFDSDPTIQSDFSSRLVVGPRARLLGSVSCWEAEMYWGEPEPL